MADVSKPHGLEVVANAGPAPWVNKFLLSVGPIVRIAFLEEMGASGDVEFRAAASMTIPDALALRDLLTTVLSDLETQAKAASEERAAAAQAATGSSQNA